MNKKQKFKKYIKENWLLWFFLVISICITIFSCSNSRYKTSNKLVESEVKQGQVLKRNNDILINTNNPYYNANGKVYMYNFDYQTYKEYLAYDAFLKNNSTQLNKEVLFDFMNEDPNMDTITMDIASTKEINLNTENITIIAQYGIINIELSYKDNVVYNWVNQQEQDTQFNSKLLIENDVIFDQISFTIDTRTQAYERLYINITNDITKQIYDQGYIDGYNYAKQEIEPITNNLLTTIANKDLLIEQMQVIIDRYNGGYNMTDDLFAIAEEPINMAKQILNWDLLGINIWGLVSALITLLLGVWIIKRLI